MSAKASDVKNKTKDEPKTDAKAPEGAPATDTPNVSRPAMGVASGPTQVSDAQADDAAPPSEESGAEYAGKLSPKEIMQVNFRDEIMSGRMKLPCKLFTLIGRVNNLRDGESAYGPWTATKGEFEAVRVHDGKVFLGKECHIPGPAGELLVESVRPFIIEAIPVTDEEFKKSGRTYKVTGEFVDVAVLVGIKASTRQGGQPYEFTVESIIPVRRSDALQAMRQRAMRLLQSVPQSQRLALAAPTPAPAAQEPAK